MFQAATAATFARNVVHCGILALFQFLLLDLHYVPGGYGGHFCPKRSAPRDLAIF